MKTIFTLLFSMVFNLFVNGQTNDLNPNGNVGIGTLSPTTDLHVVGDAIFQRGDGGSNHLNLSSNSSGVFITSDDPGTNQKNLYIRASPVGSSGQNRGIYFQAGKYNDNFKTRMVVTGSGEVGIGTISPTHLLHVAGSSKWSGNASSYTEVNSGSSGQYIKQVANDGATTSWFIRGYALDNVQAEFNNGGINVNGTIKAKEVNITATGWPDYVFRPEYKLMPLTEVERYIQKHGYLPNIPSEAEVIEKGINVGEVNARLLEKIEELTLYMIEQHRELQSQKLVIAEQAKNIALLLKQMEIYSVSE